VHNPSGPPRLWIDVQQGVRVGDADAGIALVDRLLPGLAPVRDVWLFARPDAANDRGFCYPRSAQGQFGGPAVRGPLMVLLDDIGTQVWLSGASCRPEGLPAARRIAQRLGLDRAIDDSFGRFDEVHLVDGDVHRMRTLERPAPVSPPGQTFLRGGRVVNRMDFDTNRVDANDLLRLWALATEPRAWLGHPTGLLRYDDRRHSQDSGHDGCQLIVSGETGRELWLQLPEPDDQDRMSGRRDRYQAAVIGYELVTNLIVRSVGGHLPSGDGRRGRPATSGHRRPAVRRWP